MLWMLPLLAALFWFITYRPSMVSPPLWNVRAMAMQTTALAVFAPTVVAPPRGSAGGSVATAWPTW
ncbi:hypothetical protein NKG94_51315 [Micromonospora sp. M12]